MEVYGILNVRSENSKTLKEHFRSKFIFLLNDVKDEVKKNYDKREFATSEFIKGRYVKRGLVCYEIDVKMWVF